MSSSSLNVTMVDAAPGNIIQITGNFLGTSGTVTLNNQGVSAAPGLVPSTISLSANFSLTCVAIGPLPDGITNGTLTITPDISGHALPCALRACSQYVQATEYIGEGMNVSEGPNPGQLAVGELDIILRRASAIVDAYLGDGIRILQVLERHKYRARREGPPRLFPYRTSGRRCPIQNDMIDQLVFVSAKDLVTVFNQDDTYINNSLNNIEILAYAIGNYALLGELEVIGYSANVLELSYTCGYPMDAYPAEIREATIEVATAILTRRQRNAVGMAPFSKFNDQLVTDPISVKISDDTKRTLLPWKCRRLS